jgi:energy-coupling factor transporter ATP-binding protein EcfA2
MSSRGGRGGRSGGRGGYSADSDAKPNWTKAPGSAPPPSADDQRHAALAALSTAPALPGTTSPKVVSKGKQSEQPSVPPHQVSKDIAAVRSQQRGNAGGDGGAKPQPKATSAPQPQPQQQSQRGQHQRAQRSQPTDAAAAPEASRDAPEAQDEGTTKRPRRRGLRRGKRQGSADEAGEPEETAANGEPQDDPTEPMQREATAGTATSGDARRRRGRVSEAGVDISNRNRQPRKDRAPTRGDADEDGAAAAGRGDDDQVDLSKVQFVASAEAGEHKFKFAPAHHKRVKIQTNRVTVGGVRFLLQERSVPGQDDAVYERNEEVWERVPRGHCIVSAATGSGEEYVGVGEMLGMRKFGYREAKYGHRDQIVTVVAIEKENGECAHLGAFTHRGVRYWMSGSKHVTIIFRDDNAKEDIESFKGMQRTKMACRVASLAADTLAKLEKDRRYRFHDELAKNDWTANAEVIFADSQHIVDYNEINELRFYAITGPGPSTQYGLCALGPDQSKELFERAGLHAIKRLPRVVYQSDEYKAQVQEIARRENSEGCVMYGEDQAGRVMCMWKEKSYPYVMERIVREAIKGHKVGNELLSYVQNRLSKMDKELRHYFAAWERERLPFLIEFAAWLHHTNAFKGKDVWDVSSQWLTLQRRCKALNSAERKRIAEGVSETRTATSSVTPIVFVGPPGCGKSTLARAMYGLLKQAAQHPRWLNQDEAGDRGKYLSAIEKASTDASVTHVLLDKSNLAAANRKDYLDMNLTPAVTLAMIHPEGPDELAQVCIDRVVGRGQSHRTLRIDEKNKDHTVKIIKDFVHRADWPDDPSRVDLDVRKSLMELLKDAWAALCDVNPTPLPPIAELDADKALALAMDYERVLARFGNVQQLFASVKIINADEVRALIPPNAWPKELVVKPGDLHVTVKYFGGEIDPILFVEHARRIGQKVKLTLQDLVYDNKGACFTVTGDFKSANAVPHLTIANAKNVPPVYSNELLQRSATAVKRIPINKTVEAGFAFQ